MVATGADLCHAHWLAVEVETLCKQYAVALQVGTPRVLGDDEIEKTIEIQGVRLAAALASMPRPQLTQPLVEKAKQLVGHSTPTAVFSLA